jgi:voltage-gated potassium channel
VNRILGYTLFYKLINLIIGYKDKNGDNILNRAKDLKVASNSKIIVLGRPKQIEAINLGYDIF